MEAREADLPRKVALVHDWITGMRGGERCLEVLCQLFPDADLFTLVYEPGVTSKVIDGMRVHASFLQRLPLARSRYRHYLLLMPSAVESFDLTGYDLILSSSHCVAKGAWGGPNTCHLCYCFTPMRYVWEMRSAYFDDSRQPLLRRVATHFFLNYLRTWDYASSQRVDAFAAISKYVARRVRRYYGREAEVIYPPVDTEWFAPARLGGEYYLVVSAMVPYKRIDVAIGAFAALGAPLKVVGQGPEYRRLKSLARSNVEFLGWLNDEDLRSVYARCRALIFPGIEDFGLVPVEAQSMGKPVIALGQGGLEEIVIPPGEGEGGVGLATGLLFQPQTPEALAQAVRRFEKIERLFDAGTIRNSALRFDVSIFRRRLLEFVSREYTRFRAGEAYGSGGAAAT